MRMLAALAAVLIGFWLKPENSALGGLALCFGLNGLGAWLYLYDSRRPRLTLRRIAGATLFLVGIGAGIGGYLWAAVTGGGY